jgi:hypothetical protein
LDSIREPGRTFGHTISIDPIGDIDAHGTPLGLHKLAGQVHEMGLNIHPPPSQRITVKAEPIRLVVIPAAFVGEPMDIAQNEDSPGLADDL